MLKEFLYIHPLGQAAAFVFGLFNLVTGWFRTCFVLPLHINFGVMFYALTGIGALTGVVIARRAAIDGMHLRSSVHFIFACVLMAGVLCALMSGFFLLRKQGSRTWMHLVHRYCNLAVIVFFGIQAVSGLNVLMTVL
jgi:hypothetical protein